MQKAKQVGGKIIFRAGWPFFWLYFRIWSKRTRILVVCNGELLLLKGWLSDGSWGLPGGGAHKRETLVQSAIRELKEETGIDAEPSELTHMRDVQHNENGLRYTAVYFILNLNDKPSVIKQDKEISETGWFTASEIDGVKLNMDARYASDHLLPDLL